MKQLLRDETAALLRLVLLGEIVPQPVDHTWKEVFAGNVTFSVGGWKITIFNDCDSFDYIDSVELPDGRTADFNDWCDGLDGRHVDAWSLRYFTSDELSQLENRFGM